ncbi:MAG: peptidoglycan-binding protein [Clostridia bacterium]|nr:peptidoglycan-binding protein [Clostridia bacterium]
MKKTFAIILAFLLVANCLACAFAIELKKGSKGEDVKTAQARLIELGYLKGKADGDFGKKTEEAVKAFQSSTGLDSTGIIDDDTMNALTGNNTSEPANPENDHGIDELPELPDVVFDTYEELSNLTIDNLDVDQAIYGTRYAYKSFVLVSEDVDWLENPRNKDGTVEDGAIYRKIAYTLEGFDLGIHNGSSLSEVIIGIKTTTREEFAPYAKKLSKFITTNDDTLTPVMKTFSKLKSVNGTFNFKKKKYDFEIADLRACASEMGISEWMLGCIFAMLNEYAPQIVFNGNSCSFSYSRP